MEKLVELTVSFKADTVEEASEIMCGLTGVTLPDWATKSGAMDLRIYGETIDGRCSNLGVDCPCWDCN